MLGWKKILIGTERVDIGEGAMFEISGGNSVETPSQQLRVLKEVSESNRHRNRQNLTFKIEKSAAKFGI